MVSMIVRMVILSVRMESNHPVTYMLFKFAITDNG